jgi:hypothetical protein
MSTIELRVSPAIGERPLDHGDHTPETTSAAARGAQRGLLLSVLLNAVVPVVVYNLALRSVTSSEAVALSLAAVVPLLGTAVELARRRRLDFIGTLAVLGIAVSLGGMLVSGDPRLLLMRESFLTGALGLACLLSLVVLPRPLMFYVGRQFMAADDPRQLELYESSWRSPAGRRVHRLITAVWAGAYVGEFLARVAMVLLLPTAVVLVAGPVVLGGITLATIAWTLGYARRRQADPLRPGRLGPQASTASPC